LRGCVGFGFEGGEGGGFGGDGVCEQLFEEGAFAGCREAFGVGGLFRGGDAGDGG
jgi:hypothetical protein